MSARAATAEPMSQMNMTPLIDVLLVLLIMFIMTVPIMTHQVAVDLPAPREGPPPPMTRHTLAIAPGGAVSLDGAILSETALPGRLGAIARNPDALLRFAPDAEARYETVDRVLAIVKRAGVTKMGFEDNGRYARAF